MIDQHEIRHFSLSLPAGGGQDNVPKLLMHLAETIQLSETKLDVQDIVFHDEQDEDGNSWPSFTVYYY